MLLLTEALKHITPQLSSSHLHTNMAAGHLTHVSPGGSTLSTLSLQSQGSIT